MKKVNKINGILCLPLPKGKEEMKWNSLYERMRRKKERYLEGIEKYGTSHEAMLYAGIKSRKSLMDYRNADKEFALREIMIFENKESEVIDLAVKGLYLLIQRGDMRAIKYLLDRRSEKYKPKGEVDNTMNLLGL